VLMLQYAVADNRFQLLPAALLQQQQQQQL
jgi:hypothetical protein